VVVDCGKQPITFIQANPEQYNDILNNYRVVLGSYQFKRCLFAKTYLYPGSWHSIYSFTFAREPVDRCISMFCYFYWRDEGYLRNAFRPIRRLITRRRMESTRLMRSTLSSITEWRPQLRSTSALGELFASATDGPPTTDAAAAAARYDERNAAKGGGGLRSGAAGARR